MVAVRVIVVVHVVMVMVVLVVVFVDVIMVVIMVVFMDVIVLMVVSVDVSFSAGVAVGLVIVLMAVAMLRVTGMHVIVSVLVGVGVLLDVQIQQRRSQRTLHNLPRPHTVELGEVEQAELLREVLDRKAGVQQRAQEHIATDTRETIAVKSGHAMTPSFMLPIR